MRPLPLGLRVCETCGGARGTSPDGGVSACYCSGVECLWCGKVMRRPISDYYDRRDRKWWHVSYYSQMAHSCPAPAERRVGTQWRTRAPDPDVRTYQEATTELAWELVEARRQTRD
jgi:hypothetical protein